MRFELLLCSGEPLLMLNEDELLVGSIAGAKALL